jgi:hypothetical protein
MVGAASQSCSFNRSTHNSLVKDREFDDAERSPSNPGCSGRGAKGKKGGSAKAKSANWHTRRTEAGCAGKLLDKTRRLLAPRSLA